MTGIQIGYQVRKKLYEGKSAFQRVEVYNLMFFGRTLFLDGVLQTAEQDEFIYHEMLCQAPLFLHPSLGNVLIIGGGDGGALREVLKHRSVKKAVVVEIDGKVVKLSRKYLPFLSKNAFSDKRTKLVIEDGKKFIKKHKSEFDVIILDLSDPNGPSKDLISLPFYKNIKQALRSNGIVSVQSGSFITQPKLVSTISKRLQKVFSHVQVRKAVVPSYYAGEYIFTLASDYNFSKVTLGTLAKRYKASKMRLKYWSPEIHQASSVLPLYLKQELK
ncbi:MAG: spermidine synthase [Candidatus Wildermuthbacteria bacterium RIFCSPHIGHO2_02_FULL_49_9]|uniref:Polyamine aminopropyltransferase n=2 Tax=Candidatus Wildermuthiibacteriota TaxID=1817923 RepID=A0A1G2QYU0_9BACT|nr:MAG: spermidine synthase [Candidatus Wildermuthbacteria bacterium RIFCSPHIGHO2_01_FULL_49_22b]OHA71380.1 MAG: spermidine synthase [Candidatus Wildermuthbacteria bacterium RIFCSPHIGHO2_02_FULL_49_9]